MKKEKQVGALPVRRTKDGTKKVLLVTTKGKRRWIIPKGSRSHKLKDPEAAAREAAEEGGVKGKIKRRPIGDFELRKRNGDTKDIEVYRLDVEGPSRAWPENGLRKRKWVSPEKAKRLVKAPRLKRIIDQA
jgi:8-oxo-dGTP pyrophosphatase MutT (NUDIX family)